MIRVVTLRTYRLLVTHGSFAKHFHRTYDALSSRMAGQWDAVKVRKTFIEFFENNGHRFGRYFIRVARALMLLLIGLQFLRPQSYRIQTLLYSSPMLA